MQRLAKGSQKTTPFYYYVGSYQNIKGVNKKVYTVEKDSSIIILLKFLLAVDDTANVTTWFDPSIKSGGAIALCDDQSGALFEIMGEPENIEQRNQEMAFKVRRYKGGA